MIKSIFKLFLLPAKKMLFWKAQSIKIAEKQKTIHIVRNDTIGDFIIFTAILPYFRRLYPSRKIVLVGEAVWQELARWVNNNRVLGDMGSSYFDELIPIDGKPYNRNLSYYYKTLKKLRLSAPEVVIQPTFSRTAKSDELVFISKEAEKIGYFGNLSNIKEKDKKENDKKYDRLIKNSEDSILEPERNKHFLNELAGYKFLDSGVPKWSLSDKLLIEGRKILESYGIELSKPIIIVFPGASRRTKSWPVDNFISLISKLSQYKNSIQFILAGGNNDKEICFNIKKSQNIGGSSVYSLCGKTKLSDLAKIMPAAKLLIGNDTFALHMASAIGISTLGLMGGGHFGRFFPYPAWAEGKENAVMINKMSCFNCNWECIYKIGREEAVPCVGNIAIVDVYNEAVKILDKNN